MSNSRIRYTLKDRYDSIKLPANSVMIDRSTKYGNPFKVDVYGLEQALALYDVYLDWMLKKRLLDLTPLIGKDLACSCKIGDRCHGDRLLKEVELITGNKINTVNSL